MRQYEVKLHSGETRYIHADNIYQAKNRCYLLGDKVNKIRPIYNKGGSGKWVKA